MVFFFLRDTPKMGSRLALVKINGEASQSVCKLVIGKSYGSSTILFSTEMAENVLSLCSAYHARDSLPPLQFLLDMSSEGGESCAS